MGRNRNSEAGRGIGLITTSVLFLAQNNYSLTCQSLNGTARMLDKKFYLENTTISSNYFTEQ